MDVEEVIFVELESFGILPLYLPNAVEELMENRRDLLEVRIGGELLLHRCEEGVSSFLRAEVLLVAVIFGYISHSEQLLR